MNRIRRTARAVLDILYALAELGAELRRATRRTDPKQIRLDAEVRAFLRSLSASERADLYATVAAECDDSEIEGWTVTKGWEA